MIIQALAMLGCNTQWAAKVRLGTGAYGVRRGRVLARAAGTGLPRNSIGYHILLRRWVTWDTRSHCRI